MVEFINKDLINIDKLDTNEEIMMAEDADVDIGYLGDEDEEDFDDEDTDDLDDEDTDDLDDEDTDDLDNSSEDEDGAEGGQQGVICLLIDIREPLVNLKKALEKQLGLDLTTFDFWLQDSQILPENTSLVKQCVIGEGLVQINAKIKEEVNTGIKKINIVDVLKPADELDGGGSGDLASPPPISLPLSSKGRSALPSSRRW